MVDAAVQLYSFLVAFILLSVQVTSLKALFVDITYVESAVAKGAVCLDGSPPAYHLHRGFGAGINNWVVHMEGGGWCYNLSTCLARSRSRLGSSKRMDKELAFSAILSNESEYNPDFYNWNRVKVRYCDGASFTGDVEEVHPVTNLHFRGARIFVAVMEELLAKGMRKAENALLSGCSAGGLTTVLHCDSFRSLLPMGTNVKCMSDAGYFVNVKDISRGTHIEKMFDEVVTLHGSAKNLPLSCTLRMKPSLCFFPQNVVSRIRTPLFILNAAYDSWQIRNVLAPDEADPRGSWSSCKIDVRKCNTYQLQLMHGFRLNFIRAFAPVLSSPARGFFINSCFSHCQSEQQMYWLYRGSPEIAHTSISKAVGDWFYDRSPFQKIDCPYPCDSSCHNMVYQS